MSFGYLSSRYSHAQAAPPTSTPPSPPPPPPPPLQRIPTPFTPLKRPPLTWRKNYYQQQQQQQENEQGLEPLPLPPPSPNSVLKFAEIRRQHKQNPVLMSREDVREKRRSMFLNKVKDAREHSRIKARGGEDEMMRVILISDHRRWHADLARTAASIPTIEEETESQLLREEENLYYLDLMDEQDRELEAILSQLDIHDDRLGKPPPQQADAYLQQQHQQHQQHQQPSQHDDEMATTCEGCDTEGSMVPLEGVHVCFCCGWSPA